MAHRVGRIIHLLAAAVAAVYIRQRFLLALCWLDKATYRALQVGMMVSAFTLLLILRLLLHIL